MIGPQVPELLRSDLKGETVLPEHPGDILKGHSPASWSLSCTPVSGPDPLSCALLILLYLSLPFLLIPKHVQAWMNTS